MIYLKQIRMENGELRVRAVCDECQEERTVRKSWAVARFKERGPYYICKSCSSSKNIRVALAAKGVDQDVGAMFVELCEEIYLHQYDDKRVDYIAQELGFPGVPWLVEEARDFVALFFRGQVGDRVKDVATAIEDRNDLSLEMSSFEEELKARALLRLEEIQYHNTID